MASARVCVCVSMQRWSVVVYYIFISQFTTIFCHGHFWHVQRQVQRLEHRTAIMWICRCRRRRRPTFPFATFSDMNKLLFLLFKNDVLGRVRARARENKNKISARCAVSPGIVDIVGIGKYGWWAANETSLLVRVCFACDMCSNLRKILLDYFLVF